MADGRQTPFYPSDDPAANSPQADADDADVNGTLAFLDTAAKSIASESVPQTSLAPSDNGEARGAVRRGDAAPSPSIKREREASCERGDEGSALADEEEAKSKKAHRRDSCVLAARSNAPARYQSAASNNREVSVDELEAVLTEEDSGDIAIMTAELDFCGKEIQQLVSALVKRQRSQLEEYIKCRTKERIQDARAASIARIELDKARMHVEEAHKEQVADLKERMSQLKESNAAKQCLVDCLQMEVSTKNDSLTLLTQQHATAEAELQTAKEDVVQLSGKVAELQNMCASLQTQLEEERSAHQVAERQALAAKSLNAVINPLSAAARKKKAVFVVSGFGNAERTSVEQAIADLGGVTVTCNSAKPLPRNVTHVVAGNLTPKVIAGLLADKVFIVPATFVLDSAQSGSWLAESSYRALIGDRQFWTDECAGAIKIPNPEDRDSGTREVCAVLECTGLPLVPASEASSGMTSLSTLLDRMKPAFLK